MTKTNIEWATDVWNPVTGCTKVSAGCKNCYAEKIAERFWGDRKFTDVECHPERLEDPLRWKKPRRIFVNSMSDLFHESVPNWFIDDVFRVMANTKHTYMILTKRPDRMNRYIWNRSKYPSDGRAMLPNVWLGVSVENQQTADERIPYLLETPAAVRFVSVEPMLEEVDIRYYLNGSPRQVSSRMIVTREMALDAEEPSMEGMSWGEDEWEQTTPALDWVICGCESGASARPFDMYWARDLRDQCQNADVPFFFKQGRTGGKLVKMPELDGQVWNELPKGSN